MNWRGLLSGLGTLLLVAGLGGFAFVVSAPALPPAVLAPIAQIFDGPRFGSATAPVKASTAARVSRPITRLVVESIALDTEVTPAALVEHDDTTTWEVPRFVAGHAEGSAGAGEVGNAILLGHVTSLTRGNVFEHLDRVQPGDTIVVYSAATRFQYVTTSVAAVPRTDTDVLASTDAPTLTLITCAGAWLPVAWDYAERLIVRAELKR